MSKDKYIKQGNENYTEYGIRLIKLKMEEKPDDLSWQDIVDLLNLDVHRDTLRKACQTDFGSYNIIKYFNENYVLDKKDDDYVDALIMNDLHLPYQREDILSEIEKHKDVDYIILGGDTADCKSCSSFPDFNKPSLEEELIYVHDYVCKINSIINPEKTKIIAIRGNHEYRLKREIMDMHEKSLSKMINPNFLDMISNGFTYYDKNKNIYYKPIKNFEYIDDFYIKLFDNLIVAHPTDFSNVEGSMAVKVSDYFLNEGVAEQGDVIFFGHTHKAGVYTVNRRQGLFVIENSCLCKPHSYSKMGKLSYTPQNYGYSYVKFKKGEKINRNNIKVIYLDEEK